MDEDNRDSEKEEGQHIKLLLTSKSFRPGRDGYDNGEMDGSAINRHQDYGSTTKEN